MPTDVRVELEIPRARAEVAAYMFDPFSYIYEVADARGDEHVELRVDQPFPMQVRYQLDAGGAAATRVAIHARGDASRFYRLVSPLMNPRVRRNIRRNIRRDLEGLARCLAPA